jgi:hypothetical protein
MHATPWLSCSRPLKHSQQLHLNRLTDQQHLVQHAQTPPVSSHSSTVERSRTPRRRARRTVGCRTFIGIWYTPTYLTTGREQGDYPPRHSWMNRILCTDRVYFPTGMGRSWKIGRERRRRLHLKQTSSQRHTRSCCMKPNQHNPPVCTAPKHPLNLKLILGTETVYLNRRI